MNSRQKKMKQSGRQQKMRIRRIVRRSDKDQVAAISFNLLIALGLCILVVLSYLQREQEQEELQHRASFLVSSFQSWQEDNVGSRGV